MTCRKHWDPTGHNHRMRPCCRTQHMPLSAAVKPQAVAIACRVPVLAAILFSSKRSGDTCWTRIWSARDACACQSHGGVMPRLGPEPPWPWHCRQRDGWSGRCRLRGRGGYGGVRTCESCALAPILHNRTFIIHVRTAQDHFRSLKGSRDMSVPT